MLGKHAAQTRARRALRGLALATTLLAVLTAQSGCPGPSERERAVKEAELYYKLGDGHFQDGRSSPALRDLLQAIKLNPEHARAHHLIGFLFMGRREYEQALNYLKRAAELDPSYLEGQNNLGACHLAMCHWAQAEDIFRKLIAEPVYRTPYIAYNNLGLAVFNQGRHEEAARHFQKAIFYNPRFCVAYNNLGKALIELDLPEEAAEALSKAQTGDESCERYAEPHLHMGRLLERDGRRDAALAEYQKCLELSGKELDLGFGCGHAPVGLRCKQKVRQIGTRRGRLP